ncbi:MAG TPA: hypothetical protein VD836_12240 [Solirubrobacteraceae bacterium]|nr:hypothetical protein [Solirubrobacteraceae bacterium]
MSATLAVRTDDAAARSGRIATSPEAAARRDLREQIARLEAELAAALAAAFPRREPARGRSASAAAGPRLLGLGELEAIRDELATRIAALARPPAAERLAAMRRAPAEHRWERVTSAELGEPGCRHWQVRPRVGLIGMLAGWWHVKLSSGCP